MERAFGSSLNLQYCTRIMVFLEKLITNYKTVEISCRARAHATRPVTPAVGSRRGIASFALLKLGNNGKRAITSSASVSRDSLCAGYLVPRPGILAAASEHYAACGSVAKHARFCRGADTRENDTRQRRKFSRPSSTVT